MTCIRWLLLSITAVACGVALHAAPRQALADDSPALEGSTTPILLRGVMVFDPAAGAMQGPRDVLIEGARISAVSAAGEIPDPGPGTTAIDCRGKYAVAGLFDCHTHLAHLTNESDDSLRAALAAFPASGITCVRDVGGPIDIMSRMSRQVAAGEIAGPEIFYTGPMLEASPLAWGAVNEDLPGFTVAVDSPGAADSVLADIARQGATLVKTFNKFDREIYRHLLETAARCSLRVVHDPGQPLFNAIPIDLALDLGVTSIEHAKAPWPFVLTDDLRRVHDSLLVAGPDPARMAFVSRVIALDSASISMERLHLLGQKMIEREAYLCPTLEALLYLEDMASEQAEEQLKTEEASEPVKDIVRAQVRAMQSVSRICVRELAAQGVKMLVGQDGVEARNTLGEMALLAECGLSEAEIIRGATIYPARWLGADERLGSIAPGKEASLLIVAGNPLEDIRRLALPSVVIQKGRIIRAPSPAPRGG